MVEKTNADTILCTNRSTNATAGNGAKQRGCSAKFCRNCLKTQYGKDIDALKLEGIFKSVTNVPDIRDCPIFVDVPDVVLFVTADVAENLKCSIQGLHVSTCRF